MKITVKVGFKDRKKMGELVFSFTTKARSKEVTICLNTISGEAKVYQLGKGEK